MTTDGGGTAFHVLARAYRPQSFDEVVGQSAIVRTLTNALEAKRTGHAYLFSGTRGVGKTTLARLLAKALNCERGPTPTPCNACSSCREIAQAGSVDVLEIDGASHNRVDDVRDLQEGLSYQPVRDRCRVIIIDEAHMLSRSAFNALLKTLEEPPPHVVFILATTESEKLPSTIVSRCQHFVFRRIRRSDLADHLRRVSLQEGLSLPPEALDLLTRHAAGSVRDALSALDQVVSFCGRQPTTEDIQTVLGAQPIERVDALLGAIAERDAAAALASLAEGEERGEEPARFAAALVTRLRDLAVLEAAPGAPQLVDVDDGGRAALQALARRLGADALLRLFQIAAQLEPSLRHARHPRLLLELATLRMVQAADLTPIADLVARLGQEPPAAAPAPPGGTRSSGGGPAGRRPAPRAAVSPGPPRILDVAGDEPLPVRREDPGPDAPPATPAAGSESTLFDLAALRTQLESDRPAVAAFLEHASASLAGDALTLSFSSRHSFFKKSVESRPNLEALRGAVRRLLGERASVVLRLEDRGPTAPPPVGQAAERRRELREKAASLPALQALGQVFGTEIVDVLPLDPKPESAPDGEP